ncbi:MAG: DUF6485 family protein [Candidatus Omnitrophica bacterium]|nr:DUF6485 family protein [Candidatus Omnitrophota bacterium]
MIPKICANKEANIKNCICTYEPCPRKGICCECIQYHLRSNEIPACFFSRDVERTYDRSIKRFVSSKKEK